MIEIISIIGLLIILVIIVIIMCSDNKIKFIKKGYSRKHLNEISFQKFAKFYGYTLPKTNNFYKKIDNVLSLINEKNEKDINIIVKNIDSNIEYTILLIRYLKNKKLIDEKIINIKERTIINCSEADKNLIKKYSPFIYNSHLQIDEMIPLLNDKKNQESIEELKNKIMDELSYLDKKMLINGVRINNEDNKIIYYSVEKKKIEKVGISIEICTSCGAITYKKNTQESVDCDYCHCKIERKGKNDIKRKR